MNLLKKAALITSVISLMFFAACGGDNGKKQTQTQVQTYSVSFNTNGGTSVIAHSVRQGETIPAAPATTRAGYDFAGWYATSDFSGGTVTFPYTVTGNATLHARWTPTTHTVAFYSDGVSYAHVPHGSGPGSDMPSDPTPRDGYYFTGWNTSQSATTANFYPSTPVMSDITVYAIWTIRKYTVTFDSNGGSSVAPVEVQHGGTVNNPGAQTRANFNFGGWYTDIGLTIPASFPVTVTYDRTFYAKWTPNIPVSSITLNLPTLTLEAGATRTLIANVLPANAVNRNVTWESGNPAVADVDQNGVVEAIKAGTATIYVSAVEGGVQASCVVTVMTSTVAPSPDTVNKYVIDSDASNNINNRIKYSFTYDDYDFYYIYLGEMSNIPIYFENAYNHKGSAITYRFTRSITNETTIRNTVSKTTEDARTVAEENSKTIGGSLGFSITQGIEAEIPLLFTVKGEITQSAEAKWEQYRKTSTEFRETKSLTNTTEWATTTTVNSTNEFTRDFSSADRNGYYRWTLFASSDVYLYVIRERNTGKIKYEFREYVIPNAYFWSLDYSELPSFRKSDDTNFEFNVSLLRNLPTPTTGPGMIHFDLNGGSGATPTSLKGPAKLPTAPQRVGYGFAGWNTAPNGTGVTYQSGDIYDPPFNQNAILYAQWTFIVVPKPTVTFSINGGSGTIPASKQVEAGSAITLPGNNGEFYKDNYMFVGWNTSSAGTGTTYKPGNSFTVTGNTTLYAKWIANPTAFKTIRTATYRITDSGKFKQSYDTVEFSTFDGIDLTVMKQQGYKTISFDVKLNIRKINEGNAWVSLFYLDGNSESYRLAEGEMKGTEYNWKDMTITFPNIDIDKFMNNKFFIRYDAAGAGADDWENRNLSIKLTFQK